MRIARCSAFALTLMVGLASAQAQPSADVEAALAMLDAATRAEVQDRVQHGGQAEREVIETMLLNGIQLRYPGPRVVTFDLAKETASYRTDAGDVRMLVYDPRTLHLR